MAHPLLRLIALVRNSLEKRSRFVIHSADWHRYFGPVKRSTQVALVLSVALLSGCSSERDDSSYAADQALTNNAYVPGHGYYHAPYGAFYPLPYNSFLAGAGYYHGGTYTGSPHQSTVTTSVPRDNSHVSRGGFTRSSSSRSRGFSFGS